MRLLKPVLIVLAVLAAAALLAALFAGYRDPAMLIDFVNILYCG
ncbi:hypothetical protein ACKVEX_06520 [Rhodocyclaceae bacterium SMB388]